MKKIVLLCLLCITVGAKAQNNIKLPLKDSTVLYANTIQATSTSDKLFTDAQTWLSDNFKDTKSFISANDKDNLKLTGKGYILYLPGNNDPDTFLTYNIDITIKNGSYSYKVYDIGYEYGNVNRNISEEYSHYLHGEVHKNSLIESKKSARRRLEAEFVFADQSFIGLVNSLKQAIGGTN